MAKNNKCSNIKDPKARKACLKAQKGGGDAKASIGKKGRRIKWPTGEGASK